MKTTSIVITILVVLCCCISVLMMAMLGLGIWAGRGAKAPVPAVALPTSTPGVYTENQPEDSKVPIQVGKPDSSIETLDTLLQAQIPENDTRDLIVRIGGQTGPIPETVPARSVPYSVGDEDTFWASNTDTNDSFEVDATLEYITENSYFWVANDVRFNSRDLKALADEFDSHIYPTVRSFFGSEWSPGVDNDPRIYVLIARGLGNSVAGYFSSADEYHPLAHEFSNAHEMFFLSADNTRLDDPYTYGVLAHELQHMIQWNVDKNETIWVNEGFAEVAALLTGYYDGGFDYAYVDQPDIPLFHWPENGETIPHYGGSFLFLAYFLDRFGVEVTRALVAHPENGLNAIDSLIAERGIIDPLRNRSPNGDDLFQDFASTLYLLDGEIGDGRYILPIHPDAPKTSPTEKISSCPTGAEERDINQFGIDYIRITCPGSYNLSFQGSTSINLLPEGAYSGEYFFWSNRADDADITLTQAFDFTDHVGALTLEYETWFDIEADFDYVYLVASTDGERWEILQTPRSTIEDPTGNSFGWGYNGQSNGWIRETVNISKFAGEKLWLRFEYITDGAVTNEGLLIDDISIPEIGYFSDFEVDNGGWEAAGFVRVQNIIPQTYKITLISIGNGGTTVTYLEPDDLNYVELPIEIGYDVDELVLIVSATNRFSRQKTGYAIELSP